MGWTKKLTAALIVVAGLFYGRSVNAQTLPTLVQNSNVPAGFTQKGYIQAATLNNAGVLNSGGTITVNGITMIVPGNSIVQFPANTLTWSDLFNPSAYKPVYDSDVPSEPNLFVRPFTTGLALGDNPNQIPGISPYLPFNATVQGNIDVQNSTGQGPGKYIVGLILPISQDLGNRGEGFINFIDYRKGRFEVGGTIGVQGTGTVVEINDPTGRYGWAHSPDPRWSVDADNPTVTAGNGYPMCLPKVAPESGALDPSCPSYNRPQNTPTIADPFLQPGAPLLRVQMPAKAAPNKSGDTTPDPWRPAPFMLGDFITYAGLLIKDDPFRPINNHIPWNQQTYISANTVTALNLAIYTAPGTLSAAGPAYVHITRESTMVGTGGSTATSIPPSLGIFGGTVPTIPKENILINGYVTESTAPVDILAIDINPTTGIETCRLLGTVLPEQGGTAGGNKGRFRFEVDAGNFQPVTRKYAAYSQHGQAQLPPQTGPGTIFPAQSPNICTDPNSPAPTLRTGNGLISGQYHAPMFIFQFPDAPPGYPSIPFNYNDMPFLNQGEGGNPSAGPLSPFPPCINMTPTTTTSCQQ